jgi:GT2 family glycosyltransferase
VYSWDRWDLLIRAVDSLQEQTCRPYEIIVVVDHNPSLYEALRDRPLPATLVESTGMKGLSGARNSGIRAASGDVVAFLDDDAVAGPDWVSGLAHGYLDPRVTGIGGAALPSWVAPRPHWLPEEFLWVVGCSYLGLPTEPAPVRNFIGANMSFRRSTFCRAGLFNENLGRIGTVPAGCEETEFCIRVRATSPDAVLLYDPSLEVRHTVPPSRASWRYFCNRCWSEGMSKATVSHLVGAGPALETERGYVRAILTRGLAAAARDTSGGPGGRAGRVAALVSGVALAGIGYAYVNCRRLAAGRGRSAPRANEVLARPD